MIGALFRHLILLPLFNLLILIYALLPGHDLGVAIIGFTLLVRLALWPLLKKQIHQQKALKELQPEIAKIKKKAKGDKQKEARLLMELYKEREINPLSSLLPLFIQLPILITLFVLLRNLLTAPDAAALGQQIINNTYGWVQSLGAVAEVIASPEIFNTTFLNLVNLREPHIVLAAVAAAGQFMQSRGLQPNSKDSKRLRDILRDAKAGKEVNQAEQTSAMMRSAGTFLPLITFVIALNLPSALALYWATSSTVATLQQRLALGEEVALLSKLNGKKAKQQKNNANTVGQQRPSKPAASKPSSKTSRKNTAQKSKEAANG